MNTDVITNRWDEIRGDVQRRWTKLTQEDLDRIKGNAERLASSVQERYGYTRERADREVRRFLNRYDRTMYGVAQKLPGNAARKMIRYPWATIATALGLGFLLGFLAKPSREC
jgi:uncharacterized protein YjbJ (UPF0337 family)